jgi:beta-lactamase class D
MKCWGQAKSVGQRWEKGRDRRRWERGGLNSVGHLVRQRFQAKRPRDIFEKWHYRFLPTSGNVPRSAAAVSWVRDALRASPSAEPETNEIKRPPSEWIRLRFVRLDPRN